MGIQIKGASFDNDLMVAALAAEQPNETHARCNETTDITKVKQTTKVRERCHGSFLRVQRALLHASWLCIPRPIPHRLAAMSGRPSATNIAWAIHSFASRRVGPLTPADGPPTGRAGPMSGPAGRPSGSHVSSGRKAIGNSWPLPVRRSQLANFRSDATEHLHCTSLLRVECPFVSGLSRARSKKQALCGGSIGTNSFLEMTD